MSLSCSWHFKFAPPPPPLIAAAAALRRNAQHKRMARCVACTSPAAYTCPACNSGYCTSSCYRVHGGGRCSERFFAAQVGASLRALGGAGEGARRGALGALLRGGEAPLCDGGGAAAGDDSAPPSAGGGAAVPEDVLRRLAALALAVDAARGGAARAEAEAALDAAVPPSVRAAFERDAAMGAVPLEGGGSGGPAPWWAGGPALGFPGFAEAGARPAVAPLRALRAGGAAAVSPAVGFGVLEALFAYAHAARLHGACAPGARGEAEDGAAAASAARALLLVASSLREDARHASAAAACAAALAASGAPAVRRTPLPSPALALEALREDVCEGLLRHGRCVVDALLLAGGWLAAVRAPPPPPAAAAKLRFYAAWAEEALLRAPDARAALARLAAGAWAAYEEGAAALAGEGRGAAAAGDAGDAGGGEGARGMEAPLLKGSALLLHAAARLPAAAKIRRGLR
jgi:hypothetical protein